MIMVSNFLFNLTNFCVIVSFLTKLLTLAILFSTAVGALVTFINMANIFMNSNIRYSTFNFIHLLLVLRAEVVTKLVILGISLLT